MRYLLVSPRQYSKGLTGSQGHQFYPDVFVCEWPVCPVETRNQDTLDTHLRQLHYRIMWVCPIRTCYRRFGTEKETLDDLEDEYAGLKDDAPAILLHQLRTFDTALLSCTNTAVPPQLFLSFLRNTFCLTCECLLRLSGGGNRILIGTACLVITSSCSSLSHSRLRCRRGVAVVLVLLN